MVQHSGRRPWGQGLVQQVTGSLFLAGTELKQDTQLSWRRNQGKPRKPLLNKDRLDKAGCQVWGNQGPESRSICPRSCQHGQREMGLDPQAPFSFLYPQGSLAKLLTHKSSPLCGTVWSLLAFRWRWQSLEKSNCALTKEPEPRSNTSRLVQREASGRTALVTFRDPFLGQFFHSGSQNT